MSDILQLSSNIWNVAQFCFNSIFFSVTIFSQSIMIMRICQVVPGLNRLTLSWRRALSYRNQSIDLQSKSIDWFLYNNGLCHERVNRHYNVFIKSSAKSNRLLHTNISIHVSHWFLAWIASPFFLINGMSVSCPSRFSQLIRIGKNLKASLFKILKC